MEISVIIPVFNTAAFLEECLDSMKAQTFPNWECLLIDDGSTDTSGTICDEYAASDSRFRVFHTVNHGVSAARNRGIDEARGKYIAFADSDDTVEKDYLSVLHTTLTENRADIAICGIRRNKAGGSETCKPENNVFRICGENSDMFVDLNRKFLLYGPVVKLYRSDIIRKNGVRFPPDVHFGEDLIFNFGYLEHVGTVATVERPLYNYRIGESGTLSTSVHSRDFGKNYAQWKIIRSFFERKGIDGHYAKLFLSNRIWGLAYNTAMNCRFSLREIRDIFNAQFIQDLMTFDQYTIRIPGWLHTAISKKLHIPIWIIQRRTS